MFLRFLGPSFLVPGVVSPSLPEGFAIPAAYGDLVAGFLAILATIALVKRAAPAIAVVWLFNIWGAADFLFASYEMGGVVVQEITPKNGALSLVPGSPFGCYIPFAVTFDPSGEFVYVPGTAYRIDPETGVLTKIENLKTGNYAFDITAVKQ